MHFVLDYEDPHPHPRMSKVSHPHPHPRMWEKSHPSHHLFLMIPKDAKHKPEGPMCYPEGWSEVAADLLSNLLFLVPITDF